MSQSQARADRMLRRLTGCSFTLAAIVAAAVLSPAPALAESCPNEQLRGENGSSQLPDCRAYERVTPADKLGLSVDVEAAGAGAAVSPDGSHVLYFSDAPVGEQSEGLSGSYEAGRSNGGWSSVPVSFASGQEHPTNSNAEESIPVGGPPDLSTLFYDTGNFELSVASGVYARNPDGSFVAISPSETGIATYVGSSADGSHAVFERSGVLTKPFGGHTEGGVLSLYERSGDRTLPVGVDTSGAPTSTCGSILAGTNEQGIRKFGSLHQPNYFRDAVSAGGSRIFFESPDPSGHFFSSDPSCGEKGEVYVREDAATTREISMSQKTGSVGVPAPQGAVFEGASANGARVVFRSQDQLTDEPAAASGGLYEYDVERGTLTFIAQGAVFGSHASFYPQVSDDGTHVYFLGEVPGNGPAGQTSLYLWDDGRTSFVSPAPSAGFGARTVQARLSPDGSTLAFTSAGNLTSYDSHGAAEVYVYKAGAGSLVCISCDAAGAVPRGDAEFYGSPAERSHIPSGNVTVDGSRVFFDSPDPLLPAAKNGLYNVYEYENGALHLLSDGNGPYSSRLVGASRDGADVIIQTDDTLVPQDQDNGNGDLYDVRIGGGFPYSPPGGCSGDSCQGQAGLVPVLSSASSASYPAGDNLAAPIAAPAVKPLTRAQKLIQALRVCRAKHSRHRRAGRRARAACEAHARQNYGSGHKAKKAARRST